MELRSVASGSRNSTSATKKRLSSKDPLDSDELEKWASVATRLSNDDELVQIADKMLMEDTMTKLRSLKKELVSTNWMYNENSYS